MSTILFIINDAPYGNERAYSALRLAGALAAKDEVRVRIFLLADSVSCAKVDQKVPAGFYNIELMLNKVIHRGDVALCGTCMDARGVKDQELMPGAKRSTLTQLADWTAESDKVLVF